MVETAQEREARYKVMSAYVRHRLTQQCAAYKEKSKLAKRIQFSPTTISSVIRRGQQVGDRLLDALAADWGKSRDDIFAEAFAWAAEKEASRHARRAS